MWDKFWGALRLLLRGQFRAAWFWWSFVSSFDPGIDFTEEDLEVY